MQVLCQKSNSSEGADKVSCSICGQAFQIFWERSSQIEREAQMESVMAAISEHHQGNDSHRAHPHTGFLVPGWSGLTKFSAAALLGGAQSWDI